VIFTTYKDVYPLASKMLFIYKNGLTYPWKAIMKGFLINKNLCFYYWLKKRIGKKLAFGVVIIIEKAILIFGREGIPNFDQNRDTT
jgi:hypothetical protein